jgi:hypothetical protein
MELLLRRLGAQQDEASFAMSGREITAQWGDGDAVALARDTRVEVERRAIVDLISAACERAPELESDWFAVSHMA